MSHIHTEMRLHIDYCKEFGISKEEMEATEELQGKEYHILPSSPSLIGI